MFSRKYAPTGEKGAPRLVRYFYDGLIGASNDIGFGVGMVAVDADFEM
jgi:hypothetical protein